MRQLFSPGLRQMRKQSSELFSCRTVDEVSFHRSGEGRIPRISSLPCIGVSQSGYFARGE
ncbi:predicted protein [Brucella sp. 83/13]|nr:predicted protein [Brucella sp. 83/13]